MTQGRDPIMLFIEQLKDTESFTFKHTGPEATDLYCKSYNAQYKDFLMDCLQGIEHVRQAALFVKQTAGPDTSMVVKYVNRSLVSHVSEILNSYFRLTELVKSLSQTTGKFTPEAAKQISSGYSVRNQTLKTELEQLQKELNK